MRSAMTEWRVRGAIDGKGACAEGNSEKGWMGWLAHLSIARSLVLIL